MCVKAAEERGHVTRESVSRWDTERRVQEMRVIKDGCFELRSLLLGDFERPCFGVNSPWICPCE